MQNGAGIFAVSELGKQGVGRVKSELNVSPGTMIGFGSEKQRKIAVIIRLLEANGQSFTYECKNMSGLRIGDVGNVEGNPLHSLGKTYIQVQDPMLVKEVDLLIKPFDSLKRVTQGDQQDPDILVTRDRCLIVGHESVYAESTSLADSLYSMCTIKHFEKLRRKYKPVPRMHHLEIWEKTNKEIDLHIELPFSAYVCIFRCQSDNKLDMLFRSPDKLLEGSPPMLPRIITWPSEQHFVLIATTKPIPLSTFTSGLPKQPTVTDSRLRPGTLLDTRNIGPGYVGGKVEKDLDNVDKLDPADWYVTSTWVKSRR